MTTKQKLLAAAGAAALLAGSFAVGRFTAPAKVETIEKEKVVIQWKDREVVVEAKTTQRRTVQRKAPPVVAQPEQPKQPEGCQPCAKCVECPAVDETTTDEFTTSVSTATKDSTGSVASEHESRKVTDSKESWLHIGPYVALHPSDLVEGVFEPSYGAKVEFRLAGPLWLDIASTIERTPTATIGLSLEF